LIRDVKKNQHCFDGVGKRASDGIKDLEELPFKERMRTYSTWKESKGCGNWPATYRYLDSQVGKVLRLSKIPDKVRETVEFILETDKKYLAERPNDYWHWAGRPCYYMESKTGILRAIKRKPYNNKFKPWLPDTVIRGKDTFVWKDNFWYKQVNPYIVQTWNFTPKGLPVTRDVVRYHLNQVSSKMQKILDTEFADVVKSQLAKRKANPTQRSFGGTFGG